MTNSKKVKMSLNIKDWLLKAQLIFCLDTYCTFILCKKKKYNFLLTYLSVDFPL